MKTTIAILAASLIFVGAPFAAADQTTDDTKADCGPGQDWIGYTSTRFVRFAYEDLGSPGGVSTCEGEHWDGQDSVQPNQDPGTTAPCAGSDIQGPESFFVGLCKRPDPNTPVLNAFDSLTPVGVRVSGKTSGASYQELYVGQNIFLVGHSVVYVGHCTGGASGLEGDSSCDGSRQTRTGVYLRDDTPPNALATVVSAAGVTKGHVSEGDCNQQKYEDGAYDPNPETARLHCGRDNTAITVETLA